LIPLLALAVVACGEDLDGGKACPALCPEQTLPIVDVILDAIAFDTTVGPYPIRGTEPGLLLASRGDSLDVRGVVRFDSLPSTYLFQGTSQDIEAVGSARVRVRIDTSTVHFTGAITLKVFDVDTTAADSNFAALVPLFRDNRLLGSVSIERSTLFLDDSVNVSLPDSAILAKIRGNERLRLGFQFVGNGDLTMHSIETGLPSLVIFHPSPGNDSVSLRVVAPNSKTPTDNTFAAFDLNDYSVPVKSPPLPAVRLAAGGLPAYRGYLRFVIPSFYLDSVTLVRAQLSIVQRPNRGFGDSELATVYPVITSAGEAVTDIRRAAQFVYPPFTLGLRDLVFAPRDSGERRIELVDLFRQWAAGTNMPQLRSQTAIVLRGANEGRATGRLTFYGLDAPAHLRPKLRLSYIPRTRFGLP